MSRRLNTNARARQPQTATTRAPHIKLTFDRKLGQKTGAKKTLSSTKKPTRKRKTTSISDVESTTSEEISESDLDEESEQADDESDELEEPEVLAPSHHTSLRGGPGPQYDQEPDNLSEAGEWEGFPEPDLNDDVNVELVVDEEFERKLFDSDDDLVYERVNEVSDSEPEHDDATLEQAETKALEAEFADDLMSHFANQIDGMSAYGFGDDSDDASILLPFSSDDEGYDFQDRHVHFQEQHPVGVTNAFSMLADSPTMTRALLPSAIPNVLGEAGPSQQSADDVEDDDYDCMCFAKRSLLTAMLTCKQPMLLKSSTRLLRFGS